MTSAEQPQTSKLKFTVRIDYYTTLLQRLHNVVQTSWTFGQRWVDVVLTSRVHWVVQSIVSSTKSLFKDLLTFSSTYKRKHIKMFAEKL